MSQKRTVLIIEDSKSFANSLASMIHAESCFEVVIAESYQRAEVLLDERAKDIFVAISDLNLPDAEDGDSVRLVKSFDIPCIAFTGMFSKSLRDDVYALGVCDYVLKQGIHDLTYVVRLVRRIYNNPSTKVLVVDDSRSARSTVKALLRLQRLRVYSAESGDEALEMIQREPDISLVLLDLVMDGIDGLTVLKKIRATHDVTEMAVIGISGASSREQLAKFIKYGANDYILKPIQNEEFFCRVNNALQTLEQFSKLKELNDQKKHMIGMAAHDIRGPLGAVMTGIRMAVKRVDDPQVSRLLDVASKGCDSVLELLNSLLDISVLEQTTLSLTKERFDLVEVFDNVVAEMSLWAGEKNQRVQGCYAQPQCFIYADKIRIREVLSNVLSNAIKYAPSGSLIEYRVDTPFEEVCIQISNEGVTVPEQEQEKLFQPFVKLTPRPTGGESSTGLGLSICKKIIEQHRGRIRYLPREGGSTFEIMLPKPADTETVETPCGNVRGSPDV
jgi:signal transduction histidine kinase